SEFCEKFVDRFKRQPVHKAMLGALQDVFIFQEKRWTGQRNQTPLGDFAQNCVSSSESRAETRDHNRGVEDNSHATSYRISHLIGCGGGGGIRTPETLSSLTVFKTAGFNRSPTPPFLILAYLAPNPAAHPFLQDF